MSSEDMPVRLFSRATFAIGLLFTVPGAVLVLSAFIMMFIGEGGFTDAAPMWLLILLAGFIALVPGAVFLFVSRRLRKTERSVSAMRGD